MTSFEEIEITIDHRGKVHLSVRGVPGETCLETTEELEALLGNLVEDRQLTAEYYQRLKTESVNQLKLKNHK